MGREEDRRDERVRQQSSCTEGRTKQRTRNFRPSKTRVIHVMHLVTRVSPLTLFFAGNLSPSSLVLALLPPLSLCVCVVWTKMEEMWRMVVVTAAANLGGDHAQVVPISVFVAVLCLCLLVGHLLEENRWVNESITAILIVTFTTLSLSLRIIRGLIHTWT